MTEIIEEYVNSIEDIQHRLKIAGTSGGSKLSRGMNAALEYSLAERIELDKILLIATKMIFLL